MIVRQMTELDAIELALTSFDGGPPILNEPSLWLGIYRSQDEVTVGVFVDEDTQAIIGAIIAEYGEHDLTLAMLVVRLGTDAKQAYASGLTHLKSMLTIERNRIVAPLPITHSRSSAWKSALLDEGFTSWGNGIHDGTVCEFLVFQHFPTVTEWMTATDKE